MSLSDSFIELLINTIDLISHGATVCPHTHNAYFAEIIRALNYIVQIELLDLYYPRVQKPSAVGVIKQFGESMDM